MGDVTPDKEHTMAVLEPSSDYHVIPNPGGTPEIIEVTVGEQLALTRAELKVERAEVERLREEINQGKDALAEQHVVRAENRRYREALVQIADGPYKGASYIAREALRNV